jgi:hypothetical protein
VVLAKIGIMYIYITRETYRGIKYRLNLAQIEKLSISTDSRMLEEPSEFMNFVYVLDSTLTSKFLKL